jgi:hypothetical protein
VQNEPNSSPRVGSAGAKRAKRTQCPKRGPEAVSSIADCGFRKACAPAPELAGPGVQTNPIGRSQSCKTKPIPAGRDAPWGPGFPARPSGLAVNCAKQTQFRPWEKKRQVLGGKDFMVNSTVCGPWPNKANSGGWDAARPSPRPGALTMPPGTGASVRHRLDAPLRETKPIPRSPIVDCRASLAMTCRGLGTSLLRGQPAFGGVRFRADEGCETKPIPASRDAARGSGFPSHPSALPVNCAKQTQFRQREKKRQVLCGKGVMVNRTSHRPQQNKANSRLRRAGRGRWGGDRGAIVRRHRDAPLQETKPIPRGRAEAMEAESATVGRPHPPPATSNLKLDTSNFKPDTLAI